MKYIIAFFLLAGITAPAFAQNDTARVVTDSANTGNNIIVQKDPRLVLLVNKQIEINELTTREARRYVQGYRILVLSTNDRNKVNDAKGKMYQEFPELKTYLQWQTPFFKLKVGNFKDREEAEEYLNDIKRFFPTGVYVVRDIIEVNPDKSDNL